MMQTIPSVSVAYARNGSSTKANELGMRPMQERAYEKRGEKYLLIKSPPASGTPLSASGISAMMISALKTIAERIALCGVDRPMMLRAPSCG